MNWWESRSEPVMPQTALPLEPVEDRWWEARSEPVVTPAGKPAGVVPRVEDFDQWRGVARGGLYEGADGQPYLKRFRKVKEYESGKPVWEAGGGQPVTPAHAEARKRWLKEDAERKEPMAPFDWVKRQARYAGTGVETRGRSPQGGYDWTHATDRVQFDEQRIKADFQRNFPDLKWTKQFSEFYRLAAQTYRLAEMAYFARQTGRGFPSKLRLHIDRVIESKALSSPKDRGLVIAATQELAREYGTLAEDSVVNRAVTVAGRGLERGDAATVEMARGLAGLGQSDEDRLYKQALIAAREGGDPVLREDDPWYIRGGLGAAEMTPSAAKAAAGGVIGRGLMTGKFVGRKVLSKVAPYIGGAAGTTTAMYPEMYKNTYLELIGEGVDPGVATKAAALSGLLQGALESIEINPFTGKLLGPAKRHIRKTVLKAAAAGLKRYGKEWSEEYAQGVTDEVIKEVARYTQNKTGRKGFGEALRKGVAEGWAAGGPLLFMVGPGIVAETTMAATGRLDKIDQQGGTPSRTDAVELGIPKDQAKGVPGRREWYEYNRDRLRKEIEDARKVREDEGRVQETGIVGQGREEEGGAGLQRQEETGAEARDEGVPFVQVDTGLEPGPPPPLPLPPAEPRPPLAPGERPASIKNRIVDEERAARGAPALTSEGGGSLPLWDRQAVERAKADSSWLPRLVVELHSNLRAPDPVESAGLVHHLQSAWQDYEKAAARQVALNDSGDAKGAEAMRSELADLDKARDEIERLVRRTGTASSYSLMARKLELREDGSVAGLTRRRRTKKDGASLTVEERAEIEKQAKENKALEERIEEQEEEIAYYRENEAQVEIDRKIAETTGKRRATIESRFREQYDTAHEYGIDPKNLREAAKERAEVVAEVAREYNEAYRAVVKATGLTPAVIRDIEEGRFFVGGKRVEISEYGGLDEKAAMLAREYPELGLVPEEGDVEQTGDYSQDLVELIKRGPRHVPEWHEKLAEVAGEMAAEKGEELPKELTDFFESRQPGEDDFDLEPEPAPEKAGKPVVPRKKELETKPPKKQTRKARAEAARQKVTVAWSDLRKAMSETAKGTIPTAGGIPVEVINKLVNLGRAYVELGVTTFSEWLAKAKADGGGREVEADREGFREAWRRLSEAGEVPSPVHGPADMAGVGRLAEKLLTWVVDSGIENRDDAIDQVHVELKAILPDITRRQTMEAICRYGEFKELKKDALSVQVRAIKGETRQVLKLEDMAERRAPLASGWERPQPGDEERRLIQRVNEAKKRGGFVVTDPDRQLKSAIGAAKTAVRNRIADMEEEIRTGEKIIKERTPLKADPELEALRRRRDELKVTWAKAFPAKKPIRKLTDAQRLKILGSALDREFAAIEKDLAAGRLGPKPKGVPLTSPEIEAKRAAIAKVKAQREELRAASPEYQAELEARETARYRRSLERRLVDAETRLAKAKQGWLPEKKVPKPRSEEDLQETKFRLDQLWREIRAAEEKTRRAHRTLPAKILGGVGDLGDLSMALMTAFEHSSVLRQGIPYTVGFPTKAVPAAINAAKAAFSRRVDFSIHEDLAQRPNAQVGDYQRGKLDITTAAGPLESREEMLRSRIIDWLSEQKGLKALPGRVIAEGVLGSERAFRSFRNTMAADIFDYTKASIESSRPWTADDARVVGRASNIFSGRGELRHGVGWSRVFFAPRWVWSRAQLAVGQPLWKGDAATRKAIGMVYVRWALGMTTYIMLRHAIYALLADDEDQYPRYNLNPLSTDFGKQVVGKTRIGVGTGVTQLVTLGARLATGKKMTGKGEIVPISGEDVPYGGENAWNIITNYGRMKLAPLPSGVIDYLVGKNVVHQPATPTSIIRERFAPITWVDIFAAEKELGVKQGTVAAFEAFFGSGLNTYSDDWQRSKRKRASRRPFGPGRSPSK